MADWTDQQLRAAIAAYGPETMRGQLAAEVLALRAALARALHQPAATATASQATPPPQGDRPTRR